MNSVFKTIGAVLATAVFASSALAGEANTQECGEVRFVHDISKPSVFRVATINGMTIENKFKLDARENRLVLPIGEHSLRIAEEPKKLYAMTEWGGASQIKNYHVGNAQDAYLFSQVKNHFLSAVIEANKAYVFSISSDKKSVKLKKIVEKECNAARKEYVEKRTYAELDAKELNDLQLSKLYKLSEMLAHSKKDIGISGRFLPLSLLTYFGIVVDDEYDGAGIRVLSAQPMSSAFKLGLRSGDKIIKFGRIPAKQRHLTPVQALEQYIRRIHYYGEMRFLVKRDGKKESIRGEYKPIIVPEAWLKLDKEVVSISSSEQSLDWHKQLYYSEFFRELVEEHAKEPVEVDRLSIIAKTHKSDKLGLKGGLTEFGKMKLSSVDPYSVFARLGIKEGDEIVSFGKEKYQPITIAAFTNYFKTLKPHETFYLEIAREAGAETILGEYEPITYPAIELVLDLKSIRNAEQTILLAHANYKKERRNKARGGSRLESSLRTRNSYANGAASGHYNNMRSLDRIESQSSRGSASKATKKD